MMAFAVYYTTVFRSSRKEVSEESIDKLISLLPKLNQDECESIDYGNLEA